MCGVTFHVLIQFAFVCVLLFNLFFFLANPSTQVSLGKKNVLTLSFTVELLGGLWLFSLFTFFSDEDDRNNHK